MRNLRLIAFWVCVILSSVGIQAQQLTPSFKDAPLRDVISYLETKYDLIFSFRDQNIKEESISLINGEYEVEDLLDQIFDQTELRYKYIDDRHLILSKKEIPPEGKISICGYIRDKTTGSALPLANIFIKEKGTGTGANENGRFELLTDEQDATLVFSYVGYEPLEVSIREALERPCKRFYLEYLKTTLEAVIVTEYLTDGIDQSGGGNTVTISPDRLSVLPGSVEPDLMSSIQMLPGIFSPDETASGLYIRGGTPDQNLILWDGIPVYHTGHFFGMISAFNPYIIDGVDVYRSGAGPEFGGRVSGVIDIHSKNDIPDKFNIGAGFNLTHGHLNATIPILKKSALRLSARRSFTDSWATPTFLRYAEKVFQGTKLEDGDFVGENLEFSDKFYFSDFNLAWDFQDDKNDVGIHFFGGLNSLDYTSEIPQWMAFSSDILKLENGGGAIHWGRKWSPQFSTKVMYTNAEYDYDYQLSYQPIEEPENFIWRFKSINTVKDEGFTFTNEWNPLKDQVLKFGYQYTDNKLGLNLTQENRVQSNVENQNFENRLHTLFLDYQLLLANVLDLNLGLRYQRQTVIGNDYFEPRVNLSARVNDAFKVKLSSSKQFQFVSQLILLDVNDIGLSNQIWVASDNLGIPVIESNQWSGGLIYSQYGWTLDVEAYVKEVFGITSLSNSFGTLVGTPFSQGNSRIRGVDVLLKKRFQNYRSWLSYTFSKAVYEFKNVEEGPFPASHDQRHALQWVHLYTHGPWEFSAGWQLRSGLPFTQANGVDIFVNPNNGNEFPFIVYGPQNAERLKPYHRFDASVLYHFGQNKRFKGFVGLSFINIYGQKNILGRQFLLDEFNESTAQYDILSISTQGLKFTPNFVARVEW